MATSPGSGSKDDDGDKQSDYGDELDLEWTDELEAALVQAESQHHAPAPSTSALASTPTKRTRGSPVQHSYRLSSRSHLPPALRPLSILTPSGTEIALDPKRTVAREAVLDKGRVIHKVIEKEVMGDVEKVEVKVESREEKWALRIVNLLVALVGLIETGRVREVPVFGFIDQFIIFGVIDEIERRDIPIPPTSTPPLSPAASNSTPSKPPPEVPSQQRTIDTYFTPSPSTSPTKKGKEKAQEEPPRKTWGFVLSDTKTSDEFLASLYPVLVGVGLEEAIGGREGAKCLEELVKVLMRYGEMIGSLEGDMEISYRTRHAARRRRVKKKVVREEAEVLEKAREGNVADEDEELELQKAIEESLKTLSAGVEDHEAVEGDKTDDSEATATDSESQQLLSTLSISLSDAGAAPSPSLPYFVDPTLTPSSPAPALPSYVAVDGEMDLPPNSQSCDQDSASVDPAGSGVGRYNLRVRRRKVDSQHDSSTATNPRKRARSRSSSPAPASSATTQPPPPPTSIPPPTPSLPPLIAPEPSPPPEELIEEGSLIGIETFDFSQPELDAFIDGAIKLWKGEREPVGQISHDSIKKMAPIRPLYLAPQPRVFLDPRPGPSRGQAARTEESRRGSATAATPTTAATATWTGETSGPASSGGKRGASLSVETQAKERSKRMKGWEWGVVGVPEASTSMLDSGDGTGLSGGTGLGERAPRRNYFALNEGVEGVDDSRKSARQPSQRLQKPMTSGRICFGKGPIWSEKEMVELRALMEPEGKHDWEDIASHFDGRSVRSVQAKWENMMSRDRDSDKRPKAVRSATPAGEPIAPQLPSFEYDFDADEAKDRLFGFLDQIETSARPPHWYLLSVLKPGGLKTNRTCWLDS
ncbi:Defects-in-morphology protein 1-like, mitochondrial protein [Pseudohyphozyma bogoriensis]|nr:Defects-in-morphology protein 1-like, mitochondrial protein [Pseudohyphozyma bogoriensis]